MQVTRIGLGLLAAGTFLLASGAYAQDPEARLDGNFSTLNQGQAADGDNEACFDFDDDDDIEVEGEVQALSGACTVEINYDTDSFNKASGSALRPGKTAGTAKLSQQIFSDVFVDVFDTVFGSGLCTNAFFADGRPERCSVKSSLKGTQVADTAVVTNNDTVTSNKIGVKCDLGANLSALDTNPDPAVTTAPTPAQAAFVFAAFAARQDVKLDSKNGKLSIKHNGVPEAATATPFCD